MNRFLGSLIVILMSMPLHGATVARLRCEHLDNPIDIDSPRPRLSWQIHSDRRGEKQTAYQVIVSDADGKDVWDSGKVTSDAMQVAYPAEKLQSARRFTWKARVWDADDKPSDFSAPATFETG